MEGESTVNEKKSVAFFERNSWYHRTKTLMPDHSVKYGKLGGFKTQEEAEENYIKLNKEFEKSVAKTIIKNKDDVSLKNYLVYWFENLYSPRIESSTQILGAYVLYDLILSNLEKDIKLCHVTTEFLDALLKKASKVCESAGNKSRELLSIAFKDALTEGFLKTNPIVRNKNIQKEKK